MKSDLGVLLIKASSDLKIMCVCVSLFLFEYEVSKVYLAILNEAF